MKERRLSGLARLLSSSSSVLSDPLVDSILQSQKNEQETKIVLVCIFSSNAYSLFERVSFQFKTTLPSSIEVVLFFFDVGVAKKFILFL